MDEPFEGLAPAVGFQFLEGSTAAPANFISSSSTIFDLRTGVPTAFALERAPCSRGPRTPTTYRSAIPLRK